MRTVVSMRMCACVPSPAKKAGGGKDGKDGEDGDEKAKFQAQLGSAIQSDSKLPNLLA